MNYDVIVLGSGPGGYVTAIRASQLGFKVAIIEKENLGGVCLNWGCIPTKALIKSAQVFEYIQHAKEYGINVTEASADFNAVIKRSRDVADGMSKGVQFSMKKNKIDIIDGFGKVKPGKKVEVTAADGKVSSLEADHIIIATGARSRELPNLPQDGKKVIGYRQAMTLAEQPKKLIVVGSGAIGVEFAHFYNAMGTEVTIVEFMPNVVPVEDEDISKQFERSLKKAGINVMTNSSVERIDTSGNGVKAFVKTAKGEEVLEAEAPFASPLVLPRQRAIRKIRSLFFAEYFRISRRFLRQLQLSRNLQSARLGRLLHRRCCLLRHLGSAKPIGANIIPQLI